MNFTKRTYLYLCISLLIVLAGFAILITNAFKLTETRRAIQGNDNLLNDVKALNVDLLQAESAMRGYYLVNNEWYLNNYNSSVTGFERTLRSLERDTAVAKRFGAQLSNMKAAARNRIERLNKGMAIFSSEGLAGGLEFVHDGQGKVLMDKFRERSRALEDQLQADSTTMKERIERMALHNRIWTIVIGAISAGLLIFLSLYFIRSEKKIARINEQLRASNRELDEYARITSHDLQEPLRMTRSFLMLLEKKYRHQLDENAQEYIFRASDGAERMQKLIVNLLNYARAGKLSGEAEATDLNLIMNEVTGDLQPLIAENGARVSWNELPVVWGDKTQLFRLFLNLTGNAIKFRKKETPPVVSVHAETTEKGTTITISDNGIGIPQTYLHKLFNPFVRLHSSSEYQGTGLGLATCRKIVEMHDGSINVSSVEQQGSVFTIFFPATKIR
ncbi:MAG: sensor histidine kinase [Chitinophagaceae bacterium]